MSAILQRNIRKHLQLKMMTASELERRSGLKQSAVQNILYGRSRNPSIEIIKSIVQELGCSIEDLINEQQDPESIENTKAKESKPVVITPWDLELFVETLRFVQKLLDEKNIIPSKEQILACTNEIYHYSYGASKRLDKKFAEWIVERFSST